MLHQVRRTDRLFSQCDDVSILSLEGEPDAFSSEPIVRRQGKKRVSPSSGSELPSGGRARSPKRLRRKPIACHLSDQGGPQNKPQRESAVTGR